MVEYKELDIVKLLHYKIVIDESQHDYLIINIRTGVEESSGSILPSILNQAVAMDKALEGFYIEYDTDSTVSES